MQARFFHALPFHLSITPEARLWRLHPFAKATLCVYRATIRSSSVGIARTMQRDSGVLIVLA